MTLPDKIPYAKPPQHLAQQVEVLRSRGLLIPDESRAEF